MKRSGRRVWRGRAVARSRRVSAAALVRARRGRVGLLLRARLLVRMRRLLRTIRLVMRVRRRGDARSAAPFRPLMALRAPAVIAVVRVTLAVIGGGVFRMVRFHADLLADQPLD